MQVVFDFNSVETNKGEHFNVAWKVYVDGSANGIDGRGCYWSGMFSNNKIIAGIPL